MSNPVTASLQHSSWIAAKINEQDTSINHSDPQSPEPMHMESIIKWYHWRLGIPETGREVMITDRVKIIVGRWEKDRFWTTGIRLYPFSEYAYWAEKPAFAKKKS